MPVFAHHLTRLLQSYTYPMVLALVLLESLGIPLPGEIALVTAAAYASHGHISIYVVIVLAALGAIIVGLVRSISIHYMPQVELFVIYFVMALVLAFRPRGLFSLAEARRI